MKLGFTGLPGAGKSTVFTTLAGARSEEKAHPGNRTDTRIATITVLDETPKLPLP